MLGSRIVSVYPRVASRFLSGVMKPAKPPLYHLTKDRGSAERIATMLKEGTLVRPLFVETSIEKCFSRIPIHGEVGPNRKAVLTIGSQDEPVELNIWGGRAIFPEAGTCDVAIRKLTSEEKKELNRVLCKKVYRD